MMVRRTYILLSMFSAAAVVSSQFPYQVIDLPAKVGEGAASVQYGSTPFTNIDLPKVTEANSTVYDWWYFDAVSPSSNASITVVFYASGEAFPGSSRATTYLPITVVGSYPNGTTFSLPLYSAPNARVWTAAGNRGASGEWNGQTAAFYSSDDLDEIRVVLDSPDIGVSGTITFKANAPAHYPCGLYGAPPVRANDLELLPGVGWVNAYPDANVTVQLQITPINTTEDPIQFEFSDGVGYHDKNWGSLPFIDAVTTWYWGHGRIGDYSIVWFDALSSDNVEYRSSYIVQNGQVLASSCQNSSVVVRPYGSGSSSTYPPTANSTIPEGYQLTFNLPGSDDPFVVTAPNDLQLLDGPGYKRWRTSNLTGELGGQTLAAGAGEWEEFNIPALRAAAAAAQSAPPA